MTEADPSRSPARPPFWLGLISGADNRTPAIGRLLGAILFMLLLVTLPAMIATVLWLRRVEPAVWFSYLAALQVYVPLIIAATAGVIAGTAFTEPK